MKYGAKRSLENIKVNTAAHVEKMLKDSTSANFL
jgi:hypothetical protein